MKLEIITDDVTLSEIESIRDEIFAKYPEQAPRLALTIQRVDEEGMFNDDVAALYYYMLGYLYCLQVNKELK